MAQKLPAHEFQQIIALTPLVSIDIIVRTRMGKVLLGKRTNEPAKGSLFVPGGRILKDETIAEAFKRLTIEELGVACELEQARFVGVFEHLYSTNNFNAPGFGTHYVVLAFELPIATEIVSLPKGQHHEYKWMTDAEAVASPEVHPYTRNYFSAGAPSRLTVL